MLTFLFFFTLIFITYPWANRIYKGNQRSVFFCYARTGGVLAVTLLIMGGINFLSAILALGVFSFWIAAIYGVMEVQSKLLKLK